MGAQPGLVEKIAQDTSLLGTEGATRPDSQHKIAISAQKTMRPPNAQSTGLKARVANDTRPLPETISHFIEDHAEDEWFVGPEIHIDKPLDVINTLVQARRINNEILNKPRDIGLNNLGTIIRTIHHSDEVLGVIHDNVIPGILGFTEIKQMPAGLREVYDNLSRMLRLHYGQRSSMREIQKAFNLLKVNMSFRRFLKKYEKLVLEQSHTLYRVQKRDNLSGSKPGDLLYMGSSSRQLVSKAA